MHAQRCPVAKLRAASQQQLNQAAGKGADPRNSAAVEVKKKQDKARRGSSTKTQERPSFFQNIHGGSAPLLPPHPQMYSDEGWTPAVTKPTPKHGYSNEVLRPKPHIRQLYTYCKDSTLTQPQAPTNHLQLRETALTGSLSQPMYVRKKDHNTRRNENGKQSLIINESCLVHGHSKPLSSLSKSLSCPSSRQTADVERLKNWHRNSLSLTPSSPISFSLSPRGHSSSPTNTITTISTTREPRRRPLSQGHDLPPPPRGQRMVVHQHVSSSRSLGFPSTITSPSTPHDPQAKNTAHTEDLQGRRSQFRRARSLFSMGGDETPKKPQAQSILRQPTRHIYRRGISGLPVQCTNRDMGVVF